MITVREPRHNGVVLKSPREIESIRATGRIVALTIEGLRKATRPGISTRELDQLAAEILRRHGAASGSLGYRGFPGNICISVNEEVVHGIPGSRRLREGDVVKFDVVAVHKGYYADAAATVPVGNVSPEVQRLMDVTRQALARGVESARAGSHLSDIGHAIESYVGRNGFSVVRTFVGHGIGRSMHEPPELPHFGPPKRGPLLRVGMVLCIEPQVNMGTYEVQVLDDGWTAVTADGKWSAHFEQTVAINDDGPQILTQL